MELRKYINIIWRRKITIFLTLLVTLVGVAIGTKRATPVYQTSTTLRIAVSASGSIDYSDYMYADRLMNTYVNIATSRPVVEEVMKQLGLSQAPVIHAEIIPNTEFIKITVEHPSPSTAAKVANTLADVLIAQSNKLFIGGGKSLTEVLQEQMALVQDDLDKTQKEYEILLARTPAPESIDVTRQLLELKQSNYASLLQQYEQARSREGIQANMITVFETATIPEVPARPRVLLNMVLGLIVGLIGGLGLALIFENFDTTLYEIEQIETATQLPALAKIPKANKRQISAFQDGFSPFAESFRNMATYLQVTNHQHSKKVLLLISAEKQQGKSMIAFHLACSLAELGTNVVVVDCDTRRPTLQSLFHLTNQVGLKDVLEQRASLKDALQQSSFEGVQVLTSGSQLAHPSQMLSSAQMNKLIKSLDEQFDYVLLDSPPILAVADVAALAPAADALILVVRQAHAQKEAVQAASNFLARQNGKFTFLVVNQVKTAGHYSYYKHKGKTGPLFNLVKGIWKGKSE